MLYTNRTNPTNLEGILYTKTTQIISYITQLRVIKLLLWLPTLNPQITKSQLYKHAYLLQTTIQALQKIITL